MAELIVPDRMTRATPAQMGAAIVRSHRMLSPGAGTMPRWAALLELAQVYFETGGGKAMHCWNPGNRKGRAGDGRGRTFYACNELFKHELANKYVAQAKSRTDGVAGPDAVITKRRDDGISVVWFYPSNPACCFSAFDSLDEGMVDHHGMLMTRFKKAWGPLMDGDVVEFISILKSLTYFTADLDVYLRGVRSIYNDLLARMPADLETTQMPWEERDEQLVRAHCPYNEASLQSIGVCLPLNVVEHADEPLSGAALYCFEEHLARVQREIAEPSLDLACAAS